MGEGTHGNGRDNGATAMKGLGERIDAVFYSIPEKWRPWSVFAAMGLMFFFVSVWEFGWPWEEYHSFFEWFGENVFFFGGLTGICVLLAKLFNWYWPGEHKADAADVFILLLIFGAVGGTIYRIVSLTVAGTLMQKLLW